MISFSDGVSGFSSLLFGSIDIADCQNHLLLQADKYLYVTNVYGGLSQKLFHENSHRIKCGDKLDNVIPELTGLLPMDDEFVELPDIQLNEFPKQRTSATARNISPGIRPVQFLECMVMQYIADDTFKLVGKPTCWLETMMSQLPNGMWLVKKDTSLTPFMSQIYSHWEFGGKDAFACDWFRLQLNKKQLRIRAKAMTVSKRHLLVLQSHEDRRSIQFDNAVRMKLT